MSHQSPHSRASAVFTWYNEKCYFEFLGRHQWRRYANLGSVLDAQLVYQGKVTRCTQTNWKWRKMAERWRHAKVIEATDVMHIDDLHESLKQELQVLRKVTATDKITDTLDLEYDPHDKTMIYTRRFSRMGSKDLTPKDEDLAMRFVGLWKNFVMHKKTSLKSKKSRGSDVESEKKIFKGRQGSNRSATRPKFRFSNTGGKK